MTDIANPQKLSGISDVVFVGTVKDVVSSTTDNLMPATQFLIETGESLKGTVQQKVVVNQEGGVAADGARVLIEDDSMIEVGHSYIFAAREDVPKGYYTVVPVHGHVEVTVVESQASRDKIKKMREAVQNEIDEVPGR